jgi:hypothetical protein
MMGCGGIWTKCVCVCESERDVQCDSVTFVRLPCARTFLQKAVLELTNSKLAWNTPF